MSEQQTTAEVNVETAIIPLETQKQMEEALQYFGEIKEIKVSTDEEYENAVAVCKKAKGYYNALEKQRKQIVAPINAKLKEINGTFKDVTSKLENAEVQTKRAMSSFTQEKERKRLEEQRKREAEAAELRRKEEERARKEREKEELYRQQGREDMADKAAARAETAEVKAVETVAEEVKEATKTKGVSYKSVFVCEIENKNEAVKACMSNRTLRDLVSIDLKALEKLANSTKGAFKVEGVHYFEKKIPIVKA